jgi:hypothetical protein
MISAIVLQFVGGFCFGLWAGVLLDRALWRRAQRRKADGHILSVWVAGQCIPIDVPIPVRVGDSISVAITDRAVNN